MRRGECWRIWNSRNAQVICHVCKYIIWCVCDTEYQTYQYRTWWRKNAGFLPWVSRIHLSSLETINAKTATPFGCPALSHICQRDHGKRRSCKGRRILERFLVWSLNFSFIHTVWLINNVPLGYKTYVWHHSWPGLRLCRVVRYNSFLDDDIFCWLVRTVATLYRDLDSEFEGVYGWFLLSHICLLPAHMGWGRHAGNLRFRLRRGCCIFPKSSLGEWLARSE